VYALSDAGERALLDHYEWLTARVEGPTSSERATTDEAADLKD